jgi:hypothetical protein
VLPQVAPSVGQSRPCGLGALLDALDGVVISARRAVIPHLVQLEEFMGVIGSAFSFLRCRALTVFKVSGEPKRRARRDECAEHSAEQAKPLGAR